jgi:hypothetical protein
MIGTHFALTRRGATQEEQAALEKDMFGSLGHPQNSIVLAWQDLYLYSQPSNPNRFITMSQLVAMLEGKAPALATYRRQAIPGFSGSARGSNSSVAAALADF